MCDTTNNNAISSTAVHPLIPKERNGECESAEEVVTSDTEDYLAESLRYRNFQYSMQPSDSNITLVTQNMTINDQNEDFYAAASDPSNIQIPIVGYEIMEERARFTVYKLKVENKVTGDFWYVFRRYTDFIRLCNRFRNSYPEVVQYLPRKRWLKNNFDPIFLEERVNGLQTLVNAILAVPDLVASQEIQDFFCLNEPPLYSETSEESKAIFEALEETISDLKQQLREKEALVESLETKLHTVDTENQNLRKLIRNSTMNCQKCQKECENFTKLFK
ncbi:unnamed protein product [Acanthoscelides obtectus]|uniref:PX domain-containing protein n=1 Tax=Acanthoscelides obtectus TaxID=200917 RepID=A0A9P0NUP3_ACAOB|nr:unnamed protein product [Acanthoscelides obtectus]CAK1633917.1 Sorting nexin-16 [Acanthoscelides obtectus]